MGSQSTISAMDDLLETVQTLWPDREALLTRGSGAPPPGGRSWFVVPHRRSPRLLVPAGHRGAGARSLWRFSSALQVRDVLTRTAGAAAVAARVPRAVPDVLTVPEGGDSIAAYLQEQLGHPVHLSLGIGNARANRKPVLEVFDAAGASVGFAKVGATEVAAARVRHEADALAALATARLGRLNVPAVRSFGQWRRMPVLVMSTLPGSPWQRPGNQWRIPLSTMATLQVAFGRRTAPVRELPAWLGIREVAARLRIPEHQHRFTNALSAVDARIGDRPVLESTWHGDWTPWNTAVSGGRVHVWDWERFEHGVPPGLDRCHWAVNAQTHTYGFTVAQIRAGLAWADRARGVSQTDDDVAALGYLAAITGRYLASVDEPGGELIRERAIIMLSTLEELLH